MACIYTYKGKQYSEQEIKDIVFKEKVKPEDIKFATLNDIANILAYSNSKIILDGWKVEYSTPLGNKYDTLEEVNNEIRGLADADVEVDLSGVELKIQEFEIDIENIPNEFKGTEDEGIPFYVLKKQNEWFVNYDRQLALNEGVKISEDKVKEYFRKSNGIGLIKDFIEKNEPYEQSKEIIEEWKKENNIQYDPEEVYSRGQGFYSSIGAYSNLELDLLLKNLIQHIEDNKKAGGEFTISAFTKPINKRLKHIEGTGDRVRFVIYPKSEHIKWAAPTDVFSGSVWDAHEKVSKDKKSELLGVSFTKAPALRNINEVSPNLADIIDNLSHTHNELGIELTTNNFRIEYDDNIDYSTKKLIDNINKILNDKYGKLVKPEIKKEVIKNEDVYELRWKNGNVIGRYNSLEAAKKAQYGEYTDAEGNKISAEEVTQIVKGLPIEVIGKQPTQTRENTTSIESVKSKLDIELDAESKYERDLKNYNLAKQGILPDFWITYSDFNGVLDSKISVFTHKGQATIWQNTEYDNKLKPFIKEESQNQHGVKFWILKDNFTKDALNSFKEPKTPNTKEYTSQALINTKIAKLKEVAKKYPRSLITSKVVPINPNMVDNSEIQYSKTNNNTEQQTPEDLLTKMIDSGAIQKDCTGGFKAKDGIRGKFTKGSQ